jgi:hypothetical protein
VARLRLDACHENRRDDGCANDRRRAWRACRRLRSPGGRAGKLTVQVEAFTPRHSNTLFGFATIVVPELHLRICDVAVHEKSGKRWASLPSKPQIDRSGTVRRGDNGKPLYVPVIEFVDKLTRDAFSARVIAALLEFAPAAFDEEAA